MDKMITNDIARQIQDLFIGLEQAVEILFFDQKEGCEYCAEIRQLVEEVADLSDLIGLQVYDIDEERELSERFNVKASPTLVIAAREDDRLVDYGVRFLGAPAGHEFTTLIHDLLIVSKRRTDLSDETRGFLARLSEPLFLQVFVTPT